MKFNLIMSALTSLVLATGNVYSQDDGSGTSQTPAPIVEQTSPVVQDAAGSATRNPTESVVPTPTQPSVSDAAAISGAPVISGQNCSGCDGQAMGYAMPMYGAPVYSTPGYSMAGSGCGCSSSAAPMTYGVTSFGYAGNSCGGGFDYASLWADYDCGASRGGCRRECGGAFWQRSSYRSTPVCGGGCFGN